MTIKDLFETVEHLPKFVNIIDEDGNHIFIGEYDKMPEELRLRLVEHSELKYWISNPQLVIYI